jgi:S-adenosylmethionine/arginine decarboxylase-like enzyme
MKGQLTIINLSECDKELVRNKRKLKEFALKLCDKIDMNPYGRPIIKRFGKGNLRGYTLVQLIETSSLVVHLDEFENKAFIDVFSCKNFDSVKTKEFAKNYFKARNVFCKTIMRE